MSEEKKQQEGCCPPGMVKKGGRCVLPDVTFTTFFMALNTSGLYHLGEIADPATGKKTVDLLLAKHTIDTMSMLQKKTQGNLNPEEAELVENSIYDLKMRYVQADREQS